MSQRGLDASAAARRHDDLPVEPAAKPGAERVGEIRAIADSLPAESPPASSAIPSPTAQSIPAAPVADELAQLRESVGVLSTRLAQIERRNLWMRSLLVMVLLASTYLLYFKVFPEGVIVQQTLMESRELKLVDRDGNPRLFLRMYSKVPVLQILDEDGRPPNVNGFALR